MRTHRRSWTAVLSVLTLAVLLVVAATGGAGYTAAVVKKAVNADKVDGIHASKTPKPKQLLALDSAGKLPASVLPAGTPGAQGVPGPAGPQGDTGVVTTVAVSGIGAAPGPTLGFLASPAQVTVASGERVLVTSTKVLGSVAATGAVDLSIDICYQSAAAGAPIQQSGLGGLYSLRVPQFVRVPITLTSVVTPGAGTVQVGLCGKSGQAGDWNSNGDSYTTAMVLR